MKRAVFSNLLMALAGLALFLLAGCGNGDVISKQSNGQDSSKAATTGGPPPVKKFTEADLVGDWLDDFSGIYEYDFKADHTLTLSQHPITKARPPAPQITGSWKLEGEKVMLTFDKEPNDGGNDHVIPGRPKKQPHELAPLTMDVIEWGNGKALQADSSRYEKKPGDKSKS